MHHGASQIIQELQDDLALTSVANVPSGQLETMTHQVAASTLDNTKYFQRLASGLSVAQRIGEAVEGLGKLSLGGVFFGVPIAAGAMALSSSLGADLSHLYDPYVLNTGTVGFGLGMTGFIAGNVIQLSEAAVAKIESKRTGLTDALERITLGARPHDDDFEKRFTGQERKQLDAISKKVEEIEKLDPNTVDGKTFQKVLVDALKAVEESRALTSNAHQIEDLITGIQKEVTLSLDALHRELRLNQAVNNKPNAERNGQSQNDSSLSGITSPSA